MGKHTQTIQVYGREQQYKLHEAFPANGTENKASETGIKPFPHKDQRHLLTPQGNKPFENTVGKGEIARDEQLLLFPQCFPPIWITFCHFSQI